MRVDRQRFAARRTTKEERNSESVYLPSPKGLDHVLEKILNDHVSFLLIFRIYPDLYCIEHTTTKVNPSYSIHIFSFEDLRIQVGSNRWVNLELAELSRSGLSGVGSVSYVNIDVFTMLSYTPFLQRRQII